MEYKPLTNCRILILEDEPLIMFELSALLHDQGAQTVETSDIGEAREVIASIEASAAVIDWQLEDATAEEVVKLLWAISIPTVIYSGYDIPEGFWNNFTSLQRPAIAWVRKPSTPDTIINALRELGCCSDRMNQPGDVSSSALRGPGPAAASDQSAVLPACRA